MNILVTGGGGFIGSNLVSRLLELGHAVTVLDNFSTGDRRNLEGFEGDLRIIEGDITEPKDCERACAGIEAVSHQAALGSVPRSIEHPTLYSHNNLHGFVVLCDAARRVGIEKIVYASSSSVYGDLRVSPKRETERGRALSPYAASKQANEDFAHSFHSAYGTTMIGFRYFNVFGERQNPNGPYAAVIPLFVSHALAGTSATIFGDGLQSRDFTYVANVVQANVLALTTEVAPGSHVVNIACGNSTSVKELYAKIYAAVGCDIPPFHAPERKGDIRDSLADVGLASRLLGYKDIVGLDAGIERTVDWYSRNKRS